MFFSQNLLHETVRADIRKNIGKKRPLTTALILNVTRFGLKLEADANTTMVHVKLRQLKKPKRRKEKKMKHVVRCYL